MSFSSSVKEELSKMNNLNKKDQVQMELAGYLISSNTSRKKNKIKFSTESEYNINRYAKLIKNIGIDNYKINIKGKIYYVEHDIPEDMSRVNFETGIELAEYEKNEQLDKALVRGAFLGSGYVNNPEKKYHLEINFDNKVNLDKVYEILQTYEIKTKKLIKEKSYTLYIKEGEEISKILAFIGGNSSVLKFEEARVIRDSSNKLNRLVNCETANFSKTIQAGKKQIEDIKLIKSKKKFGELSESLQEVANMRLKYPEASLSELAEQMDGKISKSGITHRLAAISKFADELRK
ncbi:MAG: DNA-binding protein WhiA [Clostridia bacterium]|nr:DNA-binding protein WhiA [Clostridia bacterium]